MASPHFTWDIRKDRTNRSKHGVSFNEAKTVFRDEQALLIVDSPHSEAEDRYVLLGLSSAPRLLVVCHSYRSDDEIVRIISARKATRRESLDYFEGDWQ